MPEMTIKIRDEALADVIRHSLGVSTLDIIKEIARSEIPPGHYVSSIKIHPRIDDFEDITRVDVTYHQTIKFVIEGHK